MRVTPADLGFSNLKEIFYINIGDCLGDKRHYEALTLFQPAHAHLCPFDEYQFSICVFKEQYIYKTGTKIPSALVWHEYGHVITREKSYRVLDCGDSNATHKLWMANKYLSPRELGHSDTWKETMNKLGFPGASWKLDPHEIDFQL